MWGAQPQDQSSAEYTADVKNIETWKIPKCRISLIVRSSVTRSELSGLLPLIFAASTASFDGGRSIAGSPYLLFCTTPTSSGSSCSTKLWPRPPFQKLISKSHSSLMISYSPLPAYLSTKKRWTISFTWNNTFAQNSETLFWIFLSFFKEKTASPKFCWCQELYVFHLKFQFKVFVMVKMNCERSE